MATRSKGLLGATILLLAQGACSRPAPDATPDGAVRAWLEHMQAAEDDPKEAREAFRLLGPSAQANLAERAVRAGQTEGQRTEPFELLAAGFFGLKFRPQSMKATVVGDHATVAVTGDRGAESAIVVCVRQGNVWRVEPDLPPLTPMLMRGDGGL